MASVIAPPKELEWKPPGLDVSYERELELGLEWLGKLRDYVKSRHKGKAVGRLLPVCPVGDGTALYMVAREKPLLLIHIPIGDAWMAPAAVISELDITGVYNRLDLGKPAKRLLYGYVVVQQGGSSTELYAHAFDTMREVRAYQRSCAKAAYECSEPVEVPTSLLDRADFMSAVEEILTVIP